MGCPNGIGSALSGGTAAVCLEVACLEAVCLGVACLEAVRRDGSATERDLEVAGAGRTEEA